jgi:hypothetical protein
MTSKNLPSKGIFPLVQLKFTRNPALVIAVALTQCFPADIRAVERSRGVIIHGLGRPAGMLRGISSIKHVAPESRRPANIVNKLPTGTTYILFTFTYTHVAINCASYKTLKHNSQTIIE